MTVDHTNAAHQAFETAALPPPPRAVEDALRYINRLLYILPAVEQAGYVSGPAGGDNVAELPDGTLVRVSRVMYEDGDIYKVMSDAPNGNPQWVHEDNRPELYVPYERAAGGGGDVVPPSGGIPADVQDQLNRMEQTINEVKLYMSNINDQMALGFTEVNNVRAAQDRPLSGEMVKAGSTLTLRP